MEEKPTSLQVLLQRFGRDHGNHVGESSQGEGTHTDRGPKALSGPITWQSNTITLAATRLKKKKKEIWSRKVRERGVVIASLKDSSFLKYVQTCIRIFFRDTSEVHGEIELNYWSYWDYIYFLTFLSVNLVGHLMPWHDANMK